MRPLKLTADGVDGDGVDGVEVDGVQELDGVHGDLRSEAKCVQELDGVHGGPRSEAKCQADFSTSAERGWPGVAARFDLNWVIRRRRRS
jgi:hypothetical protein